METAMDELLGDDDEQMMDEGSGDELFDEALEEMDYAAHDELDQYSSEDIDDDVAHAGLTLAQRRAAETDMRRRERANKKGDRRGMGAGFALPAALGSDTETDEDDGFGEIARAPGAARGRGGVVAELVARAADGATASVEAIAEQAEAMAQQFGDMDEAGGGAMRLEDPVNGDLREWLGYESTRLRVSATFYDFLTRFRDRQGALVYVEQIQSMCSANRASLVVSYRHLLNCNMTLAMWTASAPEEVLVLMDAVLQRVVLANFPNYMQIASEVHVRFTGLPVLDTLRGLRCEHLNVLVRVSGVVTRRSSVFPQLVEIKYDCRSCGAGLGPYPAPAAGEDAKVGPCPTCHGRGPFEVNTRATKYRNFQRITLQERPGTVPAGRIPRTKEVVLMQDLIDVARPGEDVEVTGIYRHSYDMVLNNVQGFPVFSTVIEANHVAKLDDSLAGMSLTAEDERAIADLAKRPDIDRLIVNSIAPSIFGHTDIKMALALALFGGVHKEVDKKHRIRGDINVLLLGDPGTAKSQFLKFVERLAHRAVYTTGQGASAVGLTASVHRDPIAKEWTLEGGALVLADKGVCCIDEFEKMNDRDRTSIHEAMEQQSISISKAGIVTTLQARCAIIAAANPIGSGRYRPTMSLAENVELTEPILSRFDIMCVVRDVVDPVVDENLARFVVRSHCRANPRADAPDTAPVAPDASVIPQDLLRKYLRFAKKRREPQLVDVNADKISSLYVAMRAASTTSGGMPMTVRHVESVLRLAEAHARMHLRDFVNSKDVDTAIRVVLESFVSTQKHALSVVLQRRFRVFLTFNRDYEELLLHLLQTLMREEAVYARATRRGVEDVRVRKADFETRAAQMDIPSVEDFYSNPLFTSNGFVLDQSTHSIYKR